MNVCTDPKEDVPVVAYLDCLISVLNSIIQKKPMKPTNESSKKPMKLTSEEVNHKLLEWLS